MFTMALNGSQPTGNIYSYRARLSSATTYNLEEVSNNGKQSDIIMWAGSFNYLESGI